MRLHPSQMTAEQIDAARYRPKDAVRMTLKDVDAIAFTGAHARYPEGCYVVAYIGKAIKPAAHYGFKTRERANTWLTEFRTSLLASQKAKVERAKDRAKPHTLQVGDVMRSSWGYDQTNVDYYQITRVGNRCVWVREIGATSVDTGNMCGQCKPAVGKFTGPETKHVVSHGNSIKVRGFTWATKMDSVNESSYWSSYA